MSLNSLANATSANGFSLNYGVVCFVCQVDLGLFTNITASHVIISLSTVIIFFFYPWSYLPRIVALSRPSGNPKVFTIWQYQRPLSSLKQRIFYISTQKFEFWAWILAILAIFPSFPLKSKIFFLSLVKRTINLVIFFFFFFKFSRLLFKAFSSYFCFLNLKKKADLQRKIE